MVIEKEKFFEIIKNVSESKDLNENNLLEKIKNELLKKDEGKYSTYNDLRIDKMFSVLVDSGKIVNYTLLHLAVECENARVVECLLQNNRIKVDETIYELDGAKSKLTALHIAASHGCQEIIRLLLDANANPLLENSEGLTPRGMVCNVPNKDAIIKMLEKGEIRYATNQSEARATRRQTYRSSNTLLQPNNKASEDYRNNEQTSSNSIINKNNTNKVDDTLEREQALREREAKAQQLKEAEQPFAANRKRVKQEYLHNQYLEQCALHNGEQDSLDLTTDESSSNDSGIYVSTEEAHEDLAKYLEEYEGDVDAKDGNGRTFLHFAVEINNEKSVKLLIARGADVNAQDRDKRIPLHFAVAENNEELVELLIEHGANVDAQNKDGLTPLHYAVAARNKELVKLLIEHQANIDVQGKDKRTPLYFAAKRGYVEIIECLVDSGASVNTQDKDGYTPLYFINEYIKIIKSLKLEKSEITYI
ncbi:ankyrin repeat domain-containing protein, partial [Wolbachia pipientis]|uniref:ankyrin repeat domain-containing protein n=1 Tax=Wolbachia pipientis TaxID=955 RepID=UPI00202F10C1